MYYCDIAIIGGGASALAAAIEAARGGAFVYILERLNRVGKKLLVTGNGRCNLGNDTACPDSYQGALSLTPPVLNTFGDTKDFFASLGLYTRADGEGRLYPMSNTASAVLDALRLGCTKAGAAELCDFQVSDIRSGAEFLITAADGRKVKAQRVIFAFGGSAAPKLGTDGSAFSLLKPFKITSTPLFPALAPLKCTAPALRSLKGLRANAAVKAYREKALIGESRGEVQFGDQALSGICVFDLAALRPDTLSLDLLPEYTEPEIVQLLMDIWSQRSDVPLEEALTGLFHKRIAQCLLKTICSLPLTAPASALDSAALSSLAAQIKDWRFPVSGADPEKAQATAGGICASELTDSLELKKLPGAYACGEAIDVLGPCGGYNLHWAWASGRCAGHHAAESLRNRP